AHNEPLRAPVGQKRDWLNHAFGRLHNRRSAVTRCNQGLLGFDLADPICLSPELLEELSSAFNGYDNRHTCGEGHGRKIAPLLEVQSGTRLLDIIEVFVKSSLFSRVHNIVH
ncbi:hypothetical protein FOZ62_013839, partial [Perkinsus olseni]